MAKKKIYKHCPALLDSDVHGAFMKIKDKGTLDSISAAMRQVLKEYRQLQQEIQQLQNAIKDT